MIRQTNKIVFPRFPKPDVSEIITTHTGNTDLHLQAGERATWNAKEDKCQIVTSNTIDFTAPKQFGTEASPLSGALLADYTLAVNGMVQLIYYNNATLNLPSGWEVENAADFVPSTVNFLGVFFAGNSKATLKILKANV